MEDGSHAPREFWPGAKECRRRQPSSYADGGLTVEELATKLTEEDTIEVPLACSPVEPPTAPFAASLCQCIPPEAPFFQARRVFDLDKLELRINPPDSNVDVACVCSVAYELEGTLVSYTYAAVQGRHFLDNFVLEDPDSSIDVDDEAAVHRSITRCDKMLRSALQSGHLELRALSHCDDVFAELLNRSTQLPALSSAWERWRERTDVEQYNPELRKMIAQGAKAVQKLVETAVPRKRPRRK